MVSHAVILIGARAEEALTVAMRKIGGEIVRLSDKAAEVHLEDEDKAMKIAEALDANEGYQAFCLPLEGREKKLLLADMDSTIVAQETLDELASAFGFGAEVAGITEAAMRGDIEFDEALRARVLLLKGLPIDKAAAAVASRLRINPGAEVLVKTMRARNAHTALVTGGFDVFAGPIAERIGFLDVYSNRLRSADGVLTGEVAEPIFGPQSKLHSLEILCTQNGIDPSEVIAVGDGANDCAMIEAAGLGVAYRPKPVLADVADVVIETPDLTALLALQGIPDSEWVR